MDKLKDILWPIILVGGLGAFIDFLIGKTGQAKAKDFLLKWWIKFDDVRWKNFGREEGLFAVRLMESCLGRRLWSFRRLGASVVVFVLLLTLFGLTRRRDSVCIICNLPWWYAAVSLPMSFIAFCLSVSLTKFVTLRMAYLCGFGELRNLIIFITSLALNCLVLMLWWPITLAIKFETRLFVFGLYGLSNLSFTDSLNRFFVNIKNSIDYDLSSNDHFVLHPGLFFDEFFDPNVIDTLAIHILSVSPNLFRSILSLVFIGSFVLKPLVMRPVSLVWVRIVESEKPVFTLTFGGAAAFATAISEAAKHL